MAKPHIKVTNIVSSATPLAWSQTYHAGGVTAVVSVKPKPGMQPAQSLSIVGKDLLNTFESEYFTLETKSLASIKSAVDATYEKSKEGYDISLIVTAVIQNAVYVILAGTGRVLLIRSNTLATLLQQEDGTDVLSASGFLEADDVMILETLSFAEKVSSAKLLEVLTTNTVEEAAEILSPTIHSHQTGSEAALLFSFHDPEAAMLSATQPVAPIPPEQEIQSPKQQEKTEEKPAMPKPEKKTKMSHRQKIFLTIAIVIAIVFAGTVYFSLQKKQTNQNAALFSSLYPPAERKYEEGIGLKDLNESLAHDDFIEAQSMLNDAKGKFPANSPEEKQILALLGKVNAQLPQAVTPTGPVVPATNVVKVDATTDPFLGFVAKNPTAKYFTQDTTSYYFADNTGITQVNKATGKSTQIITNSGDWKSIGGFATYLGNMYIVDTADGIDKYPAGASGFGNKVPYFTGTAPDLSKVTSMAIDMSIWLLGKDGTISEYTRGKADTFTITGLTTPLSSPTQLVTSLDDANLYILDNGNSRLVVIKKTTGAFVAEYHSSALKTATQVDISEKNNTAFILSGGTIYQMALK